MLKEYVLKLNRELFGADYFSDYPYVSLYADEGLKEARENAK